MSKKQILWVAGILCSAMAGALIPQNHIGTLLLGQLGAILVMAGDIHKT